MAGYPIPQSRVNSAEAVFPVDPATGIPVPTGSASSPLYVITTQLGAASIATGQATATTSASILVPARSGRISVTIENLGATDTFLGASGVTSSTGMLLVGTKGSAVTIYTQAAVYGIVGTGTQAVSFLETF